MVGKRKNSKDNKLPVRVYRGRCAFEWKPRSGGTVRLCGLDAPLSKVWLEYENVTKDETDRSTFKWMARAFFGSADFDELGSRTQRDYIHHYKKVGAVFDRTLVNSIKPEHIRIYMDKRGLQSRVQANREHAFMSKCFRWGYERGLCKLNPCQGVKKYKESSRTRYVTDVEYDALYKHCGDDVVRVAMELAYLCCARRGDVLAARRSQVLDDGLYIAQGKTGVQQIKLWSPRLKAAIALSKQLTKPGLNSLFIVSKPDGSEWSGDGFAGRWRKAVSKVREVTGMPLDFTYHDLKGKGISDLDGTLHDKQVIAGHKTPGQTAAYDRKIKRVPTVDGQRSR
ncbi:integrase [Agarivorans sp. B2Z047]|uniref:integrase n=1 Tax=Agarivorans sp. B2Z047 TaxID=2652721 RepID=UPI00128D917A|nr:integrase [Agarivorans sp. B2Z047]MPW31836.1 integrase [Agarivorans sp. B2Z047]UQN41925.1 integrase [Agarivorans sp. B2Z047]